MVVKVYVSGISGNKEVKKRQQRVLMILDSKNIKYDVIDITEPGKETEKDFMQNNSKSNGGTVSDPNPRSPLPPQLFNDEEYCGDYDLFDLANEVDTLEQFLKLEVPPEEPLPNENDKEKTVNGNIEEETNKESEETSDENTIAKSTEGADESGDTTVTEKEGSLAKEDSPLKEAVSATSKEGSPVKGETGDNAEDSKEKSPEKELPERQKSIEKEGTPQPKAQSPEKEVEEILIETKESSPENEEVNENGTVSSREHSQEKDAAADLTKVESKQENPSDALIQSEQAAGAE
ncbi:unnamed protein product [Arctia plantaginis]|uniref:SH3 domain-binding glutamic acid-rich protein n=1 Tax=Arctia plantaginis TaxID=874455 RepID=A0A8S1ABH4_ARCPL|nr:unnamed protein product [Arctia plantaginis]CAB3243929.1 unnamed protein product [Arctia plantaginis]